MDTRPKTYGVNRIADMLGISPLTVRKWTDRGLLPSFRIPGSRFRRVYEDDLIEFLTDAGIRIPESLQ